MGISPGLIKAAFVLAACEEGPVAPDKCQTLSRKSGANENVPYGLVMRHV